MATIDANVTETSGAGVAPPYAVPTSRYTYPGGESFANLMHGAGNSMPSPNPVIGCVRLQNETDKYYTSYRIDCMFDLREFAMLEITDALFYAKVLSINNRNDNIHVNPDWFGLVRQRESLRGLNSNTANHYEGYWGGINYGAMSNTQHLVSSLVASTWYYWTLNSTGVTYLNTVNSKADLTGYAPFTLGFGNTLVDNEANATWTNNQVTIITFNAILLRLTYESSTPPASIEIGSNTKIIQAMQINVSGTWRYVAEMQINIGDVWKDII